MLVTSLPALRDHASSLRTAWIAAGNEAAVAQGLGSESFLRWIERGIQLEQVGVGWGWVAQILLPAPNAGANEFCDEIRMLSGNISGCELDPIGIISGRTYQKGANVCPGLLGEEWLTGDEDLLHVVGVGEEVGNRKSGWNLANLMQALAGDHILEPSCTGLCGDGVAFQILEVVYG